MPNLPTWPDNLPQFPFGGDDPPQHDPQSNVIRTSMSTGPAKMRRRSTARVENVTIGPFSINQSQLDALETFVLDELGEAKPFLWYSFRHKPEDRIPAVYRFMNGWSSVKPKRKGYDNMNVYWYDVTLELEKLPWV